MSVTRLRMFPFTNKIFVITGCLSSGSVQRTAWPGRSLPHIVLIGAHSRDRTCTLSRRFLRTVCLPIPPYGQSFWGGLEVVLSTVCGWPCHSPLDSEAMLTNHPPGFSGPREYTSSCSIPQWCAAWESNPEKAAF